MTADARRGTDRLVVDTAYGPVRGVDDGIVKVWKGVRYAAAPAGDLRWRAPQPAPRWHEPRDATRVGPACPQPTDPRIPLDLGAPQEDCLSLNVWASSDTEPGAGKPVWCGCTVAPTCSAPRPSRCTTAARWHPVGML